MEGGLISAGNEMRHYNHNPFKNCHHMNAWNHSYHSYDSIIAYYDNHVNEMIVNMW